MSIAKLQISVWQSENGQDLSIDRPTWQDVESAIRALDGHDRNDLYLQPDRENEETYLCIGGGTGRYVATGCINNERFPTWLNPGISSEPQVELTIGGQPGFYPNNWILSLEAVLHAARSFYETGEFKGNDWVDV